MYLKCDVVWLLVWIGISRAGRNRLAKIENKVDNNITKTAASANQLKPSLLTFCSTPANPISAHPNTDCLATSNGVCTKRNIARFWLLLFKNKINNNSWTYALIHFTSLATFYFRILLLK